MMFCRLSEAELRNSEEKTPETARWNAIRSGTCFAQMGSALKARASLYCSMGGLACFSATLLFSWMHEALQSVDFC